MKYILTSVFSFLAFVSLHSQGIEFFHGTYQEAIELAQEQEKIIFVDAYTTWCGPCKRMAATVFTQKEAGDFFNSNFINLKIDMEKTNGREFGSKYPVSAYPTLFFLDPKGKMLKKSVGGKQLDALLALGNEILSQFDFSAKYKEAYESGDRSFENVVNYIDALNKSNKSSLKIANDYLSENETMSDEQLTEFLFKASSEIDSKIFEMMLDRKSKVISKFGQDAFNSKVEMAAKNTIDKGIQFEDMNLIKQSLKMVNKADKEIGKKMSANANLDWAFAQKDEKMFLKAYKPYLKVNNSIDSKVQWANKSMEVFPKNSKVQKSILSAIEKDLAQSVDKNHISLMSKLFLELGKKEDALKYVKAAESRIEDAATKTYISNLIKYIENYNS